MELTLNEPVVLPWPGMQRVQAICWVRIYRDRRSAVVVIADVPGNPGPWPDTVDSQIVRQLAPPRLGRPGRPVVHLLSRSGGKLVRPTH